jgi:aconitate hydratase
MVKGAGPERTVILEQRTEVMGASHVSRNSFGTRSDLPLGDQSFAFHSLPAFGRSIGIDLRRLPFAFRVLLENMLRHEDGRAVTAEVIEAFAHAGTTQAGLEVAFHPNRVIMPDSSGIPLLVDFAAMRDAMVRRDLDPRRVDLRIPAEIVVDHSVAVDAAGSPDALLRNMALEMGRNGERYGLLRWAEGQFQELRVVAPGNGIVHQVNMEHLATVVAARDVAGTDWACFDSLVGTDSHTPMINGLGVFGWGVGGIEAMTALLGEPVSFPVPRVVGCRLSGAVRPGVLAADVALTLTARLRAAGLVGAIVEFFGPGLVGLPASDRATIANMAPEYGATMGYFPIDAQTIAFLCATGRDPQQVALVEAYARAQGVFCEGDADPVYGEIITFDLGEVRPSMAGPSRPEARLDLSEVPGSFSRLRSSRPAGDGDFSDGAVVIASITSCTNTSNPHQMVAAGLLARNAVARGLRTRDWVKTSLSPGSRVVTDILRQAELITPLAMLGFDVVGYGCMSCAGNAGPLAPAVSEAIAREGLAVAGVLSSNRNFEGRLHPTVRGTYLGSPPLVVAYALAGTVLRDLANEPLGSDWDGHPVRLSDIWPSEADIREALRVALTPDLYASGYAAMADGGPGWRDLPAPRSPTFPWDEESTAIRRPPFLEELPDAPPGLHDIPGARILLMLGDDVTTDHISPGGAIPPESVAGCYLREQGVRRQDLDTYIGRRANDAVMVRGTFANPRLRNELLPGTEGGLTRLWPEGRTVSVFDAAMTYRASQEPAVIVAGRNYGCGSSRDWAAKGTQLLGIRAVIAESFERIHRSNLVGMGILPLQFAMGTTRATLELTGRETISIQGLSGPVAPGMPVEAVVTREGGPPEIVPLLCRIDTTHEAEWMRHGGIMPYALRTFAEPAEAA